MREQQHHQPLSRLWPFKGIFYGWAIVSTSVVVTFAQVSMYGPVLSVFVTPIEEELGWERWETAMAFTIGSLGGSIGSAAVGHLLDRYGARTAVVVAGMIVTAALLGLAVMQEVWQFWLFFGVGRTAALTGVNLGLTVALGNWFIRKRGRAVSFMSIGLRAGQALVPLVIVTPLILAYSWRHAYFALALMAFLFVALPGWLIIRRRPEDYGLPPDGVQPGEAALQAPGAPPPDPDGEVSFTLAEAKRTPAFWLLTIATMTVIFAQTAVNLHAVPSVEDRGVSQAFSGAFVFIIMGTAALSAYGWGALMDKFHVRWGTAIATVFSAAAMIILMFADNILMASIFGVLFGLGTGGWTIAQTMLFANYFGRRHLGAIRGLSQLLSAPLSSFGAVLAGAIQTATGSYTLAFLIFFGALVIVVLALLLATPPRKPVGSTPS
ncbi:MAG: MFS transporter [Chloroflexi bacterium]|nr:MFS transporter [Chloroflexota bacterium]